MPKSRNRKGRKPYRPKPLFAWGADPLETFRAIGEGRLDEDEEEAAAALLLNEVKGYDPAVMKTILDAAELSEPPTTTDHIRAIARALTESEQPDATESRSTADRSGDQQDVR